MVEAALRKVSNVFSGITRPRTPKVQRTLLLILSFRDKKRFVIESEQIVHKNRHCFKVEAVSVLVEKFGFGRVSDLHVVKPFQKKGTEYHPLIVQWEYLDGLEGPFQDLILVPLEEHALADKLSSFFP